MQNRVAARSVHFKTLVFIIVLSLLLSPSKAPVRKGKIKNKTNKIGITNSANSVANQLLTTARIDKSCPFVFLIAAPYLAGMLGVPEHPRNLGVQKGAKPDFCLSDFCYYYEHPRIKKAKYGSETVLILLC